MANCPKCQLPNPDAAATCIWCGRDGSDTGSPRNEPVAIIGHEPDSMTNVTIGIRAPVPAVLAPQPPSPFVEPILTPSTPPPERKPLPSHVGPQLAAGPGRSTFSEPITVAQTPPDSNRPGSTQVGGPLPLHAGPPRVEPPPPPPVVPKLVVLRGLRPGQEFPVYEGRNVIGRFADKPVDIDLAAQEPEGQIWSSRHHAAITFDRNLLLVEDLNSLNGTWVNGTRLHPGQPRPLKANDVIQIGTVQLKLLIG